MATSARIIQRGPSQGALQINDVDVVPFDKDGIRSGQNVSVVRQTVQYGAVTMAGAANMLSGGSGLNLNLSATVTAMRTAFAAGASNYVTTLSADANNVVSVAANNTSYVSQDYVSPTSVAWNSTLAQPQYGVTYNQSLQSKLDLNNTSLDDFGSAWTNNAVTFSNASPAIAGTYMGVFNGTSSYMRSTAFNSMGPSSWTLRCKFIPTAVTASTLIISAGNGGTTSYGVYLGQFNSKLLLFLSSNGTSWDIASSIAGTTTLVNGNAYDVEATYDPIAGKYFVYLNGVAEITVTSALKICPITNTTIGCYSTATPSAFFSGSIQGFEFLPYCKHPNGIAFTPQTVLSSVATQGYASDFFNTSNMVMGQVSAPSVTAGVGPTVTPKNRVYIAQSVTNATNVTSTINYAINGSYDSGWFPIVQATQYARAHNIGVVPGIQNSWGSLDSAGAVQGQWLFQSVVPTAGGGAFVTNQTNMSATLFADTPCRFLANATYNLAAYARMVLSRGW